MSELKILSDKIVNKLKLRTKPVGLKVFKEGLGELSEKLLRPRKHLHQKLTLCQMIGLSRFNGIAVGAELEDMGCPGTMLIFGMIRPPSFIREGRLSYGLYTETQEDGVKLDLTMPIWKYGAKAIATAPLDATPFDPSVVVIYGTPAQIMMLVAGYIYKAGEPVGSSSYAKAGSDLAIVASMLDGKPKTFIPGLGDRIVGHVEEYELGFVTPTNILDDIVYGMENQEKSDFIVYPPKPILVYPAKFEELPVIGKYYKQILDEVEKREQ
ncbi:MAG: DUF169 domain-containing protein [Desulfurococcales archaeon]|nr:DUF169 domain-containing protein [Desulfurococcales archaeon]